ncbi:MAG: TolB family protein [Planctomycetota bacterium]
MPTPKALSPSDPHQRGKLIVFPVIHADKKKPNTIWIMNEDGTKARQLTKPVLAKSLKGKKLRYRLGDFDPKISPDGSKVALMRQVKKEDWHIIVVNVNSGEEKDLSPGGTVDAMPEWSSDGKLLVFWHVDPKNPLKSGLYTIKADGTERKKIPLPRGYFYSMPSFVPGEGSDKQTRIIYSARIAPKM